MEIASCAGYAVRPTRRSSVPRGLARTDAVRDGPALLARPRAAARPPPAHARFRDAGRSAERRRDLGRRRADRTSRSPGGREGAARRACQPSRQSCPHDPPPGAARHRGRSRRTQGHPTRRCSHRTAHPSRAGHARRPRHARRTGRPPLRRPPRAPPPQRRPRDGSTRTARFASTSSRTTPAQRRSRCVRSEPQRTARQRSRAPASSTERRRASTATTRSSISSPTQTVRPPPQPSTSTSSPSTTRRRSRTAAV